MGQGSIIGYEINEKTCQISFYNEQQMEPDTLEVDADNFQIPLIIGKLRDTWAYGKEAKRLGSIKEGFTVTRLLSFRKSTALSLPYRFYQRNWHRCSAGSRWG